MMQIPQIIPPKKQHYSKKERNSSVEMFRLLATLLVLVVHLNGWMAGGMVEWSDDSIGFDHKVSQLIIQSLCIVCVNCFLIISGWYGLCLKFSSIWKIWYMLASVYVPFYLIHILLGRTFSIATLLNQILAFSCENYFIQNYLMLMFLSPALNAFIEKYGDRVSKYAVTLFAIEVILESVFQNKCLFIEEGYSLIHFITIYLLARAASINKEWLMKINRHYWIVGYLVCAAIVCLLSFTPYKHTWAYSNPIVVIESFMLFFPFLYKDYSNRLINSAAKSAIVVYLIQVTNPVCDNLFRLDQYALAVLDYKAYLPLMLCFSITFFLCCLLYSKVMDVVLKPLLYPVKKYLETKIINSI